MSEYSSLKATINANVKTNDNHEITGLIMNSVLNAMVNSLGAGYQFMGVATPTNPGTAQTPDYKCFYLATTPGTYTYLGGLVVADGEVALLKWDTAWTKEVTGIATADKLNQLSQELDDATTIYGTFENGHSISSTAYSGHRVYFIDSPVERNANIKSLNITTGGTFQNIRLYLCIGNKVSNTIVVERVYPLTVNPLLNVLDEPISINQGQYIGWYAVSDIIPFSRTEAPIYDIYLGDADVIPTENMVVPKSETLTGSFGLVFGLQYVIGTISEELENLIPQVSNIQDKTIGFESLIGKKVLCVGDSITDNGKYTEPLAEILQCTLYNRGAGGTTMAVRSGYNDSFCERMDKPTYDGEYHTLGFPSEADIVFLYGGVNDWGKDVPLGNLESPVDNTTFCGALHYMLKGLKTKYPSARIILINNYRVYSTYPNFAGHSEISFLGNNESSGFEYVRKNGKTFDDYRQAVIDIAKMYGCEIIDMLKVGFSFWWEQDRTEYSLERPESPGVYDGLHPSVEGGILMAKYIAKHLESI